MSWTNLILGSWWQGRWPDYVDVISPDHEMHINYVPLMPWDGEKYHCIHCGAELHGYQRRCECGKTIYGYEDNGAYAVLDAAKFGLEVTR
jgi:hypothetical protein